MTKINLKEFFKNLNNKGWFVKYIKNPLTWIFRATKSSYLCIRFPFLYPRNCWNGKHWQSTKLVTYYYEHFNDAYKYDENGNKIIVNKLWDLKLMFVETLNNALQIFHFIPTTTNFNLIEKGWRKCFGIQMCKEIKQALLDNGGRKALKAYRINDIKEKYGSLRIDDSYGNKDVEKVIMKYEYISEHTCIKCGKPADYMTKGYILPYCNNCITDEKKENADRYLEDIPFYGYRKNAPVDGETI